jgi:membrane protein implicated in regulation of membrane protease activity
MVHRPRSVFGYVLSFLIVLGIGAVVISLLGTLSSPWLWGPLAVIVSMSLLAIAWRRRVEAAQERAWVGSFSFAEVVTRRRAEEAQRRAESTG